jgi:DNA-binding transcriptional MerR regulator/methylmalonyl-CoA mutase cobalamin-binding subunit
VFVTVYHVQTMYNIKQAAARAGVTVPVLRAWERRYAIVHPARTPAGYRLFDDESVARVRAMRALVDEGWSPSAAAAAILAGGVAGTAPAGMDPVSVPTIVEGARDPDSAELGAQFVAAARALGSEALASTLDDMFARGSFERVAADLLFPALEELGDAWARGDVSVAGEHLASHAVLRRLALALEAAGPADPAERPVLVGLPPGGRHELGALAFAIAARRAGLPVAYLGPDLPLADWVAAAANASGAVIGVVTARDRTAALEVARRLRAERPELVVALGGRAAPGPGDFLRLPSRLPDSVVALKAALDAAGDGGA